MYYLAKAAQFCGLIVIGVDFALKFPKLMNPKILIAGMFLWAFGFIVERYMLKR